MGVNRDTAGKALQELVDGAGYAETLPATRGSLVVLIIISAFLPAQPKPTSPKSPRLCKNEGWNTEIMSSALLPASWMTRRLNEFSRMWNSEIATEQADLDGTRRRR